MVSAAVKQTFAVCKGSGLPIFFIHGFGVDHRIFEPLDVIFEKLGGFQRIYVDMPGMGRTPPMHPAGGLTDLAQWLDEYVESCTKGGSFAMVGNSLGGLLIRRTASQRMDRCKGLAFLAPVVHPKRSERRLPPRTVLREDPALLASVDESLASAYQEMAVVQTREHLETYESTVLPGIRIADPDSMARLSADYELAMDFDDRWQAFRSPALFICGRQDSSVGYQDQFALSCKFPQSTYAALNEAGHNVHIEQPRATAALIQAWAEQVQAQV
ncbi:hydrolase [Bombiscardovia apis]|uniref:Hydrolase n=2 Tax=Bombiscardovia apis TaxID=2932182 RepID=A0ABM8BC12_9BIFI|nr:hydrolase [Bombiscardovia apis]